MLPRTRRLLPRLARLSMTLGIAAIAVTACHPAVRGTIAPSASGLVVRNTSAFDVNVYAMPSDESTPVWLATVPASGTRFLALERRQLQRDSGLVVRTQALASSATWTSGKL